MKGLLGSVADLYENNLFLSYLYELLDFEPRVKEPSDPLPISRAAANGLRFDRVWFRYPGTEPMVLKDVSFSVRPGEVIALVGENGSGKNRRAQLVLALQRREEKNT